MIPATDEAILKAIDMGAKYKTVASFTLDEANNPNRYFAPLYLDFDAENIDDAIKDARTFLHILKANFDYPLSLLRIFMTGGRGVHIEIPAESFSAEDGDPNLIYIYKLMVEQYGLDTLDLRVYNQKKGRMWRLPNVKRSNGNYKVPITAKELLHKPHSELISLTRQPRHHFEDMPSDEHPFGYSLIKDFQDSRETFYHRQNLAINIPSPLHGLNDLSEGVNPLCITELLRVKNLNQKDKINFNNVALHMASYYSNAGISPGKMLTETDSFCNQNFSSSKHYNTPDKRKKHLAAQYQFVSGNDDYKFQCGVSINYGKEKLIRFNCADCPLNKKKLTDDPGKKPGFIIEDCETFLKRDIPEPEYIVNEIIGKHKLICIAGDTGVGKTMLSTQLGLSIALGVKDFLGFPIPTFSKVIYFNLESGESTIHHRLGIQSNALLKNDHLGKIGDFSLNRITSDRFLFQDNWDKMRDTISAVDRNDLIIVDNLYTSTSVNDEQNVELKQLLAKILELSDLKRSSVMLITHHKKHPPDEIIVLNQIRGGSTLVNAMDTVIQLGTSLTEEGLRLFKITKNRDESPNHGKVFGLKLDPETLLFENKGLIDEYSHLSTGSRYDAAMILLDMDAIFTSAEFKDAVIRNGKSKRTSNNWLNNLEANGSIRKLEHGKYQKVVN
ncbi:AAA family ATPase [candidate division KSB1 bacterium]|nr:AAA family ATPase [candidate division KSB1 bacterium]